MCTELDDSLAPLLRRTALLTDYAWKYRYPGEPHDPPRAEAESALELAREAYDAILTRLPADARPPR